MSYNAVKHLKPSEFKRLCGVHSGTFEAMLAVLKQAESNKPLLLTKQVKLGRPIVNDIGILERIPDIFPHWSIMGGE